MSKLSSKSIEWLKDAEQKYIVNMPEVTEENRSRVKFMQDGLKAVQEELAMRLIQQKKSPVMLRAELNPSLGIPALNETPEKLAADREAQMERENKAAWFAERQAKAQSEQLPQKPELEEWAQKIESEQKQNVYRQALEKVPEQVKQFVQNEVETRILAKVENPKPIAIPVVQIEFKDGHRQLNQVEIMSLLKTYFKRVATSAGMEAGRYSNVYNSNMGKTVYKLFQGWNIIYNETEEGSAWPPLEDCFPGFGRASQNQKVNAEILWRWASKK